ncbi:MAG: ACT domain-containing protein [Spirochaetales bacterium]|nr:ACT domain-containing protein [Spirochaetales bacterium]
MRSSFITSVPDKSGAFLKAVKIFSTLNLNIVRTSYNKAVDSHMIFLEVDGDEKQIEEARKELKNLGYLNLPQEDVALLEFFLPDVPGTLEKVLSLIEERKINISYISSVSNGTGWQNYRMGLLVKSKEELDEFLESAERLYRIKPIDYGKLENSYDNSIFYSGFVSELSKITDVRHEDRNALMLSANMAMELLNSQGLKPDTTFSSIAHFTRLLGNSRNEGFKPRVSKGEIKEGYDYILIEPPCGSNTVLITHNSSLLAIDSGYALYRKEMETLFDSILPEWREMDRTLFLTHADVDHGGLFPLFDKIVCSKRSRDCLYRESKGQDGLREENRLHRPYIRMCKILTHYTLPDMDKVEAVGGEPDFTSSSIEKSGSWNWEGLDFTLYEGAGGHLKGESLLVLEKEKVAFTGDIWVNIKDMTALQSEYNTLAPVLMTSVDTDPMLSKKERERLKSILLPNTRVFPGHGNVKTLVL